MQSVSATIEPTKIDNQTDCASAGVGQAAAPASADLTDNHKTTNYLSLLKTWSGPNSFANLDGLA